jgi:flagellum-specific peptidoglycan hydrolase FlgJ
MATVQQDAWLKTMVAPAQLTQAKWRVPASVTLAQCIFESDWGRDPLVKAARNYFGIKAVAGEQYCEYSTEEDFVSGDQKLLAKFAKYPSVNDSFEAHAQLIATLKRYQPCMAITGDVEAFCHQLQVCGYSTSRDPVTRALNYGAKLFGEIKVRNLQQYDITPPDQPARVQEAA